jgi:hypothetical protein
VRDPQSVIDDPGFVAHRQGVTLALGTTAQSLPDTGFHMAFSTILLWAT